MEKPIYSAKLQEIDNLKAEIDALRPLKQEELARVNQYLRLDWNYHSNAIEGNSLTRGETQMLLMHGLTAHGKPLKDHEEIIGHDAVLQWLQDIIANRTPLSEGLIREFHKLLLVKPYEVDVISPDGIPAKKRISIGEYKKLPNSVKLPNGLIHFYEIPEAVPGLMAQLMEKYKNEQEKPTLHSVELAAYFHYEFVRIHPFDDGNGRMARILMNLILMQNGYYPIVIKIKEKNTKYLPALEAADIQSGNIEMLTDYLCDSELRTLELVSKALKGEEYRELEQESLFDKELFDLTRIANAKFPNSISIQDFGFREVIDNILLLFLPHFNSGISSFPPVFKFSTHFQYMNHHKSNSVIDDNVTFEQISGSSISELINGLASKDTIRQESLLILLLANLPNGVLVKFRLNFDFEFYTYKISCVADNSHENQFIFNRISDYANVEISFIKGLADDALASLAAYIKKQISN